LYASLSVGSSGINGLGRCSSNLLVIHSMNCGAVNAAQMGPPSLVRRTVFFSFYPSRDPAIWRIDDYRCAGTGA
jgi:hypothetical protein